MVLVAIPANTAKVSPKVKLPGICVSRSFLDYLYIDDKYKQNWQTLHSNFLLLLYSFLIITKIDFFNLEPSRNIKYIKFI